MELPLLHGQKEIPRSGIQFFSDIGDDMANLGPIHKCLLKFS